MTSVPGAFNQEAIMNCCRVCEKPDEYANLFYNINKELLRNLVAVVHEDIHENDGLSKWLCRECFEVVENFTRFRDCYQATTKRVLALINVSTQMECIPKLETENFEEILEIPDSPEETHDQFEILEQEDTARLAGYSMPSKASHNCNFCSKSFGYAASLYRHIKSIHEQIRFNCFKCKATFTQKSSLKIHMKSLHKTDLKNNGSFDCSKESCKKTFWNRKLLQKHLQTHVDQGSASKTSTEEPKP